MTDYLAAVDPGSPSFWAGWVIGVAVFAVAQWFGSQ